MKVPPQVISLYWRTARKYKKLVSRLNRENVSPYQRHTLLQRLRKIIQKLNRLHLQVKIAAAAGTVTLLLNQTPASAQASTSFNALGPFVRQNRINNPLREPIFNNDEPVITTVDFDGDGDQDVVLGEYGYYGGVLRYFENQSSQGTPVYLERVEDNPFRDIHPSTGRVAPAFADIDRDGDLDLFLGQHGSYVEYQYSYSNSRGIEYFRNDGGLFTEQTGPWDPLTRKGNPVEDIQLGYNVTPVFVDFDYDGDLDLVVGSQTASESPTYTVKYIHYYQNDGGGGFTASDLTLDTQPFYYYTDSILPSLGDLDEDGDLDMVIGTYYDGYIRYYKQETPGSFVEQTDVWDPEGKTGNPFSGFYVGRHVSPAFIDFDGDGNLDLFVADALGYNNSKYSDHIINYYPNSGNATFSQEEDFDNPFGGVFVKGDASPVLLDIDGDTDLDAVIGNKYQHTYYDWTKREYVTINSYLTTYQQGENKLEKSLDNDLFRGLEVEGYFAPQFADVDNDGDLDMISGDETGHVVLFRNNDGTYSEETGISPFAGVSLPSSTSAKLVDINNDGDLDLFMSNSAGEIHYFENTGTSIEPAYTLAESPLGVLSNITSSTTFLHFTDLDHDGDFDLLFNGRSVSNRIGGAMWFVENIGTPERPVFGTPDHTLLNQNESSAQMYAIDHDADGDLDVFAGKSNGTVAYLKNENPVVQISLNQDVVEFENGASPLLLAPALILTDADSDTLVRATIVIQNHLEGERLDFASHPVITGAFDLSTGVLTLTGKGSLTDYETVLRSVTFSANYQGGRRGTPESTLIGRTIQFSVLDQDLTHPQVQTLFVQVFVNDPPSINSASITTIVGGSAVLDLKTIISDPNGSSDVDLSSLKVIASPGSGAITSIDVNGVLTVDYANVRFIGSESIEVEVCDQGGLCARNTIAIEVTNTAPSIAPEPVSLPAGSATSINLMTITSDAEGNLDPEGFSIVGEPASAGIATIAIVSDTEVNLHINYDGLEFYGTDNITIQACDLAGACSSATISVDVNNSAPVIQPEPVSTPAGSHVSINLMAFTSDVDGNINQYGFTILGGPTSTAPATIEVVSEAVVNLNLNYAGIAFSGTDQITIQACDLTGVCSTASIVVAVTNTPPLIQPEPVSTTAGSTISVNLMTITSDVDGNLDPDAFDVINKPRSNARASIEIVSPSEVNLQLDYEGLTFRGTDEITIRACDYAGACSENILSINVDLETRITVYNAVAPNSPGDNRIMRITGLPENNKVSIFNRWGDKVFEVENYTNEPSGNAFRGLNTNGATLPSATYFYIIEIPGEKIISGYLTLKQ